MNNLHPAPNSGVIFMEDFDEVIAPLAVAAPPEPEPENEPDIIIPSFTAEDLEAARQAAYGEGMRAGQEAAQHERAHGVQVILDRLERDIAQANQKILHQAEVTAEEIARTLMSCLYGSLPAFCRQHAESEIRALIGQIMPGLAREPKLEIRVHPDLVEPVKEELKNLRQRLPEILKVIGDGRLEATDLRAQWNEGHLERNSREIWAEVKRILEAHDLLLKGDANLTEKSDAA